MASDRLEELAREMYAAELEVFEDGVAYGRPGVEWDCLSEAPTGKPRHRAWASAACEYFGFVNAKGEVVVPKRGAGAALVEAVKAIGESVREAEAAEDSWVNAKALDHIGNIAQAVLDGLPKPEEVLEGEDLDDNAGQT